MIPTTPPAAPTRRLRGPKGARVGDLMQAERSVWRVEGFSDDRREVIARLTCGSHALRRFRARRIERVWRSDGRAQIGSVQSASGAGDTSALIAKGRGTK